MVRERGVRDAAAGLAKPRRAVTRRRPRPYCGHARLLPLLLLLAACGTTTSSSQEDAKDTWRGRVHPARPTPNAWRACSARTRAGGGEFARFGEERARRKAAAAANNRYARETTAHTIAAPLPFQSRPAPRYSTLLHLHHSRGGAAGNRRRCPFGVESPGAPPPPSRRSLMRRS